MTIQPKCNQAIVSRGIGKDRTILGKTGSFGCLLNIRPPSRAKEGWVEGPQAPSAQHGCHKWKPDMHASWLNQCTRSPWNLGRQFSLAKTSPDSLFATKMVFPKSFKSMSKTQVRVPAWEDQPAGACKQRSCYPEVREQRKLWVNNYVFSLSCWCLQAWYSNNPPSLPHETGQCS